jgi:large subunit ribosomal protein L28e
MSTCRRTSEGKLNKRNLQAVGISVGEKGEVVVTTKKAQPNKPAQNTTQTSYSAVKSNRK